MVNTTATMCFACGKDNPIGLKLEFEQEGEVYRTRFIPAEVHQSYDGMVHGGLICTLLDEIMGRFLFIKGIIAPTAEMNVRFKRPVPIKEELVVEGEITGAKGRLIQMKAVAKSLDGTVLAEATGKFIKK